jgi:hypothetical protein
MLRMGLAVGVHPPRPSMPLRAQKSPKVSPGIRSCRNWFSKGTNVGTICSSGTMIPIDEIQPVAQQATAYQDRVLPPRFADQPDVAVVGTRTAVRAACHPDGKGFVLQTQLGQLDLQLVDHAGQSAFAVGDRQSAGRPRDASHRPTADGRILAAEFHLVPLQDRLDLATVFGSMSVSSRLW